MIKSLAHIYTHTIYNTIYILNVTFTIYLYVYKYTKSHIFRDASKSGV